MVAAIFYSASMNTLSTIPKCGVKFISLSSVATLTEKLKIARPIRSALRKRAAVVDFVCALFKGMRSQGSIAVDAQAVLPVPDLSDVLICETSGRSPQTCEASMNNGSGFERVACSLPPVLLKQFIRVFLAPFLLTSIAGYSIPLIIFTRSLTLNVLVFLIILVTIGPRRFGIGMAPRLQPRQNSLPVFLVVASRTCLYSFGVLGVVGGVLLPELLPVVLIILCFLSLDSRHVFALIFGLFSVQAGLALAMKNTFTLIAKIVLRDRLCFATLGACLCFHRQKIGFHGDSPMSFITLT